MSETVQPGTEANPSTTTADPAASAPATTAAAPAVDPSIPPPSVLDRGVEDKGAADGGKTAAPAAPEAYEFKPPEVDGKPAEFNAEAVEAFKADAKALGLTQEQFQGVVEKGVARIQDLAMAPYKAWADQQRAWVEEINADPLLAGDKRGPSLAAAAKAIDAFGGDDLRKALKITGADNNPAMVRAFINIGLSMGDATKLVTGGPATQTGPASPEERARALYNANGGNYASATA